MNDQSQEVQVVDQERQNQLTVPEVLPPESAGMLVMPTNPAEMLAVAVTQGRLDVESMKALMELEKEYRAMQAKVDFDKAVAKFAGLKEPIAHNQRGQAGKAKFTYADFPQMVSVITPWLKSSGLSFSHFQDTPEMEGANVVMVMVHCLLKAKSGHVEKASFPGIPDQKLRDSIAANQLLQAAVTYAKRQTLAMVLGLSTGEDGAFDHDAVTDQATSQPDTFSEDTFESNLPKWTSMIEKGERSVGDIMNLLASKGKLTDEMKQKLRAIKGPSA